jgi:hypothetical protein
LCAQLCTRTAPILAICKIFSHRESQHQLNARPINHPKKRAQT